MTRTPHAPFLATALLVLLFGTFGTPLHADSTRLVEDSYKGEHWQTVSLKEISGDEEKVRGHLLFTLDSASNGAAFRCDKANWQLWFQPSR